MSQRCRGVVLVIKHQRRYSPDPLDRVLNLLELERADRVDSKDIAEMTGMVEMLFKMVKELHARR